MKLTRKREWLATLSCILLSTALFAETYGSKMKEHASGEMETGHSRSAMTYSAGGQTCHIQGRADTLQSADELMAMKVHNPQGHTLGTIQELILDDSRQTIEYVILSREEKFYPVPWTAFIAGTETYTLDITPEQMGQAPMMTSLDIERLSRPDYRTQTLTYYADQIGAVRSKLQLGRMTERITRPESQTTRLYTANGIIGTDVKDTESRKLGEMSDVVFDVRQGNLAYGLISFGGMFGMGEKTAAVPWESIDMQTDRQMVTLDTDRSTLQQSVLPAGQINRLCEPEFARQIHQGFDQAPYWEVFGFVAPGGAASDMISDPAWQPTSMFNRQFNPNTVQTMTGTVKKVSTFTPEEGALPGLKLKVQTDQGRSVIVYAGPQQHYLQQSVRFNKGDQISITGSQTTVSQKDVVMACRIRKGSDTVMIRDMQGNPTWIKETMGRSESTLPRSEENTGD